MNTHIHTYIVPHVQLPKIRQTYRQLEMTDLDRQLCTKTDRLERKNDRERKEREKKIIKSKNRQQMSHPNPTNPTIK